MVSSQFRVFGGDARPTKIRWGQGGGTPPLRERTGIGTVDKGDPAGRPYGKWELGGGKGGHIGPPLREGVEGEHVVRPYGFTGWKPVPPEIPPNPPWSKGGFFHLQPGPQFSKDGAPPDFENARSGSKGQDKAQTSADLARRLDELLHWAQIQARAAAGREDLGNLSWKIRDFPMAAGAVVWVNSPEAGERALVATGQAAAATALPAAAAWEGWLA